MARFCAFAGYACLAIASASQTPSGKPQLPTNVMAGYTLGASPDQISLAVEKGMNVLFWSFMQLNNNQVVPGFTTEYVSSVVQSLPSGTDVLHFVSIGGWNFPHNISGTCGNAACSGAEYAKSFRAYNEELKANVPGFAGFAGIDWDYEGMDDLAHPSNEFSLEVYELMLNMTQELNDEFLFSLVPAQSYFNCVDNEFSPSLKYPADSNPSFTYAGKNAYAVLYAKCPNCFDLIMIQLYEGWSQAGFDLYWAGDASKVGQEGWPRGGTEQDMRRIVHQNMQCVIDGWTVGFDGFWGVETQTVALPPSKVVIALGNGWTVASDYFKFPFFSGTASGAAYCDGVTTSAGLDHVRGFAYWDIGHDDSTASFVTQLSTAMTSCSQGVLSVVV